MSHHVNPPDQNPEKDLGIPADRPADRIDPPEPPVGERCPIEQAAGQRPDGSERLQRMGDFSLRDGRLEFERGASHPTFGRADRILFGNHSKNRRSWSEVPLALVRLIIHLLTS